MDKMQFIQLVLSIPIIIVIMLSGWKIGMLIPDTGWTKSTSINKNSKFAKDARKMVKRQIIAIVCMLVGYSGVVFFISQ